MPGAQEAAMPLGDTSEYEYVTREESFFEKQYTKYGAGDKLSILNVFALISLAFGTRGSGEIFAGVLGFVPHYYIGGDGLDGMISAMTGVQLYKRRWKTVAFPLILESLRTLKDFTKGKAMVTKLGLSRTAIFVGGYLAAMSRIV
mgnify:CR=1 FL=1